MKDLPYIIEAKNNYLLGDKFTYELYGGLDYRLAPWSDLFVESGYGYQLFKAGIKGHNFRELMN